MDCEKSKLAAPQTQSAADLQVQERVRLRPYPLRKPAIPRSQSRAPAFSIPQPASISSQQGRENAAGASSNVQAKFLSCQKPAAPSSQQGRGAGLSSLQGQRARPRGRVGGRSTQLAERRAEVGPFSPPTQLLGLSIQTRPRAGDKDGPGRGNGSGRQDDEYAGKAGKNGFGGPGGGVDGGVPDSGDEGGTGKQAGGNGNGGKGGGNGNGGTGDGKDGTGPEHGNGNGRGGGNGCLP